MTKLGQGVEVRAHYPNKNISPESIFLTPSTTLYALISWLPHPFSVHIRILKGSFSQLDCRMNNVTYMRREKRAVHSLNYKKAKKKREQISNPSKSYHCKRNKILTFFLKLNLKWCFHLNISWKVLMKCTLQQ